MKCAFCENQENKDRQVHENEHAWCFPTSQPIVPGHLLIIPKRCVAKFVDMNEQERSAIFELLKTIQPALKQAFDCSGFNLAWNEGAVAGQTVPHFHLHVVPRKDGDTGISEYEPRKFLYRPGSREDSPQKELLAVTELVRSNIQ
ncbi:HIT family protein [Patescibacteria group bacterium]